MSKKININGKEYALTIDSFGVAYIEGLTVEDWLSTKATAPEIRFLMGKGLDVAIDEPEHLEDIIERTEMPREEAELMRKFKGTK